MKKIACLYSTNIHSQCIFTLITLINHINTYEQDNIDLFIYNNNENLNDIIYDNNYCEYSYNQLQIKHNYIHMFNDNSKKYAGNVFLTMIDLYLNHPNYDKYIFYEDDLAYINTENIFSLFDFNNDIIFQNERHINYDWMWYTNKNLHNINLVPYMNLLNIYMLSPHVLKEIYKFISDGNFAHHEYIINSFILSNYQQYNWTIGYINGRHDFDCFYKYLQFCATHFVHPIKSIKELKNYCETINMH